MLVSKFMYLGIGFFIIIVCFYLVVYITKDFVKNLFLRIIIWMVFFFFTVFYMAYFTNLYKPVHIVTQEANTTDMSTYILFGDTKYTLGNKYTVDIKGDDFLDGIGSIVINNTEKRLKTRGKAYVPDLNGSKLICTSQHITPYSFNKLYFDIDIYKKKNDGISRKSISENDIVLEAFIDNDTIHYKTAIYIGTTYNGEPEGNGTYKWADGGRHTGEFVHGKFNGQGIRYFNDGVKYIGLFKNDLKHGKGIWYYKDGSTEKVEYINGKEIKK